MSRLICLLGLHGSGKTSAGRFLQNNHHVSHHISIGDLARLARSGSSPSDVPVRLIVALAKHKAGNVFDCKTAELLAEFLSKLVKLNGCISVDGFPSSAEHIPLLCQGAEIWKFEVDEKERFDRLLKRSELTKRKWVAGVPSERDKQIDITLEKCRDADLTVKVIENNEDLAALHLSCLKALYGV